VSSDSLLQTDDLTAAAWIAPRIGTFGSGVRGVIPAGFEAYARILHPAESDTGEGVRWDAVASACGKIAHPLMQFHTLVGVEPTEYDVDSAHWTGSSPDRGNLEPESLAALLDVLARHTAAAQQCWFCLWDGYGGSFGTERSTGIGVPRINFDARVELPQRRYVLFGGPLAAVLEVGYWPTPNLFLPHSPNIFWPDDVSWCVASEIDLFCTYVGGSRALIDELLAGVRLEVWEAHLEDPVAYDTDAVNR
jgi:hypothetical protein